MKGENEWQILQPSFKNHGSRFKGGKPMQCFTPKKPFWVVFMGGNRYFPAGNNKKKILKEDIDERLLTGNIFNFRYPHPSVSRHWVPFLFFWDSIWRFLKVPIEKFSGEK